VPPKLSAVYSEGVCAAQTVTLVPGDGIGPDLTDSVKEAIGALDVEIE
jgi:isocitrate/isopropylmalate dehydrogenase